MGTTPTINPIFLKRIVLARNKFSDEKKLIAALNAGEKDAYQFLYENYYQALCVYASSLTQDDAVAEDLVQNLMIKLWNKKPEIVINKSLSNYLYRAVYNLFISHYRKHKREIDLLAELRVSASSEMLEEETDHLQEKLTAVKHEIHNLPERTREVFMLYKMDGLQHKEIAEYLNLSIKTVEYHISKALKLIKDKLKDF